MKAIAIVGSSRIGNTTFLAKEALGILQESSIDTELVHLKDKEIKPCDGCLKCKKSLRCAIEEDDFEPIFETMQQADGIIVGSPVYFGSATSQLISLLDRAAYVQRNRGHFFSGKIGGPIVVARRAGHNFTLAQLLLWYFINDMLVVGSTYWNIAMAGSAGKHDIEEDQEGIDTIRHFARSMAGVMKKMLD